MIGVRHRNGRVIHGVGLQRAWVPWRDPSCLCAFDADPGFYVKNGSGVSRWNDLTGHGYHALQPTALNQPTWVESDADFRGHGSLLFDGSLSHLFVESIPIPAPFGWFVVAKWGTNSTTKTIVDHYNSPGYRQNLAANSSGKITGYASSSTITGPLDMRGQVCVMAFVVNGASSALYCNALTPIATGNAGNMSMPSLNIGALAGQYNMMQGKIASIIGIAGVPSTDKIARILRYLGSKYGRAIA